jgi:hypothetical protein
MALFLLFYLAIYGSLHAYFVWKVARTFHAAGPILPIALSALCLFMIAAPILTHVLDRAGHFLPARILALVGYTWTAWIFWFFALAVVTDLWNLAVRLGALAAPGAARFLIPPAPLLAVIGALILAATLWGLAEAAHPRLRTISLELQRLPNDAPPLRIVQIADVHLGLIVREGRLRKILRLVNDAQPDLLVSAGDLVDASFERLQTEIELLAAIQPRQGKFAVLGNHEFYAGLENSVAFHRAAGFHLLRGESVQVGDWLRLAGVDDPAGRHVGETAESAPEDALLPAAAGGEITVLLKHQPRVRESSSGRFDLQLSGHTHGGQIFPFGLVVRAVYRYGPGLHSLGDGSTLFVSRGSGTWGPPLRLFSPPEVTLITIGPARRRDSSIHSAP